MQFIQKWEQPSLRLFLAAIVVVTFILYATPNFLAAGRDDGFIMLWAGQSLGNGPWFQNYNGEPQEIASSVAIALLAAFTKPLTTAGALLFMKMAALFASILTLIMLIHLPAAVPHRTVVGALAALATAFSTDFGYWTFGELETAFQGCLLLAVALTLNRALAADGSGFWPLASVLFLTAMVRSEGLWAIPLAAAFALVERNWHALRACLLAASATLLYMVARYYFSGALWPNPVYAKVGNLDSLIPQGLTYVLSYGARSFANAVQLAAVVAGAGVLIVYFYRAILTREGLSRARFFAILSAICLGQIGFTILVGGNWMEYFRFIAPLVPLMNALLFGLLALAIVFLRHGTGARLYWLLPTGALLAGTVALVASNITGRRTSTCAKPTPWAEMLADPTSLLRAVIDNNCAHSRDRDGILPFIETELAKYIEADKPIVFASSQGGYFPYHIRKHFGFDRVLFLDTFGLTDRRIGQFAGVRGPNGLENAWRISVALTADSDLGRELRRVRPKLIYQIESTPESRAEFRQAGYDVIWDRPAAIVFKRRAD